MEQYVIKKVMSGPAKGRYVIIVNGWELFETWKTVAEAEQEVTRRQATHNYGHDYT